MKIHLFSAICFFVIQQNILITADDPNDQLKKEIIQDICKCVHHYECANETRINGFGIIDIRMKGVCDDYLKICCNTPDLLPENEKLIAPEVNKSIGCGYRNPNGVGFRITGDNDNEAQFGEFPWMVAVLRQEYMPETQQTFSVYQCGGSLIHPQVVLTAAHCVLRKSRFKIRAGEWDTQIEGEIYPHQDRFVKTVIKHPQYYSGGVYNDIALLILEEPVDISEHIDVVCLPPQGATVNKADCLASGWGKDAFGSDGHYQVILKRLELPIVNRQECQTNLRKTRLGPAFNLHSSFICAGGEYGKDTCSGDGGSPLVCPLQRYTNRYVQVGAVAFGIGCGQKDVPGAYANVALYRNWIDEQMKINNFDTSLYVYDT